jgi:hypothetical protein
MWVRIHLILYIEAAPRNPGPIKLPGVEVGPHGIFGRLLGIQPSCMSRMGELNGDWTGLPRFFEAFCILPSTVRVY